MDINQLEECFEKFDKESHKFDRIEKKFSTRPDLHAFILLDKLIPSDFDIITAAEHDEIYLDGNLEVLAFVATEDDIRDLIRCGVMLNESASCLYMFA